MTRRDRVVDHLVEVLARRGVRHLFGVGGANIEDLYDAVAARAELTPVLAKHEFAAAAMADGYSRSGAGLGVVCATSGGGCLNTLPALAEAYAARVPVLALLGQPSTALDGRGAFQDTSGVNGAFDAAAAFTAVSRYCRRVDRPADLVTALPEALTAADRGGPAVLLLPKDVQQAPFVASRPVSRAHSRCFDPSALIVALRRAGGATVVIAGEQVARDDARDELRSLREHLGAQLAVVPDALDVAPGSAVTGVMGHDGVAAAVARSRVCLLIGTRMPVTARAGLDDAFAATSVFSIGSAEPHVPCTHLPSDDLRADLSAIVAAVAPMPAAEPLPRIRLQSPSHDGPGLRYGEAMAIVDAALPERTDIVVDAGNIGAAALHGLPARPDGRYLVALGMGGMGHGFGAAIGAALHRGRRTVLLAGDGAFYMHGMEIHTAVQHRLPVTFLLFDNHAHAMCVTRDHLFYGSRSDVNRFGPSRLGAGLATMFPPLRAHDVTEAAALPSALADALAGDGPAVVAIECSADEIPPFTPFLTHLEDYRVPIDVPDPA